MRKKESRKASRRPKIDLNSSQERKFITSMNILKKLLWKLIFQGSNLEMCTELNKPVSRKELFAGWKGLKGRGDF